MIAVGMDTHKHEHVAAALNELGELLGEITVAASPAGYRELVEWLKDLGEGALVGIEGVGSYGAGLCKYLQDAGVPVLEVERPRRRDRRTGKSDRIDALLAAKKVLAGEGLSTPKTSGYARRTRGAAGCLPFVRGRAHKIA
jgi:transposase